MSPSVSSALLRTQTDARLGGLAAEGQARAFEAIVERYRSPLHRYLRRLLPAGRVEDVLQQTFLTAWASLSAGTEVREVRPWLYRIAHNAAVNALKRSGYDYEELRDSLRGSDGPDTDVERRTVMRETLASVASLPERQRRALLETAVEGRSQADVAREMGLSEGAFRQLVHRARTTVRAAATAFTPLPLAAWAAGAGGAEGELTGGMAARVAELAAGAGGAGVGATALKTGAVVVAAGALAAAPTGVVPGSGDGGPGGRPATALAEAPGASAALRAGSGASAGGVRAGERRRRGGPEDRRGDRRGRGGRGERERGDDRGRGGSSGSDDESGSRSDDLGGDRSGSGSSGSRSSGSGDDRSGRGGGDRSGEDRGGSGDDRSGSGDEGSGSSGSSGSGSSGSGSSGLGSSGSGSGSSGSESSGSGSSASGSSGSESSGSGSSGSGSSGSSGPGGGDLGSGGGDD